jgi:hypothetical protein
MRDVLEDFFANGPRAKDPNSGLRKFMTNIAPRVPTALFVLGMASTAIGVLRLVYTAAQSDAWHFSLLLPWGITGIALLTFAP